jgi:hypothetical protein
MEEEMMQGGGEAPMGGPAAPDMGPDEEQLNEAVMMIVEELMKQWQETGEVAGQKIESEQEAKKYAMALAMEELEKQAQGGAEQAPPPQDGGMAPAGGGMAPPMGGGGAPPMM